jgi:hypothetical protein
VCVWYRVHVMGWGWGGGVQVQYLASRHVDRILVVNNGTIAEEGTYQELSDRGGLFLTLLQAQRQRQGV